MSLLKALRESCQKIETATTSWNQNLFSNLAKLREEGIATDVEVVVFDKKGLVSPAPILAHSLVLAAISPALASILASSGDASEGFTLIFPGGDRGVVEDAIKDLYSGQKGGIAFLQSWGLLRGEGGGEKKVVKEETHSDEDEDDYVQDNFDLHGETDGREDNNDEIPLQHPVAKQIMDRVKRSNRNLGKISYAEEEDEDDWDGGEDLGKKSTLKAKNSDSEANIQDDEDWKPEKVFEHLPRPPNTFKVDQNSDYFEAKNEVDMKSDYDDKNDGQKTKQKTHIFIIGHEVKIRLDGRLQCPYQECERNFSHREATKKHMLTKHKMPVLPKQWSRAADLSPKKASQAKPLDDMDTKSEDEEETFQDEADVPREGMKLKTHIFINGHEVKFRSDGRLQCPYQNCDKNFSHRQATKKHMLKVHKMPILPKQMSQPVERSQIRPDQPLAEPSNVVELCGQQVQMYQDGRAQCPQCDTLVSSATVFVKHYESVHLKLKETCEHCGKEYSKHHLKLHIERKHSNQRHYCDQCDYSSTFKGDIRVHKASQHDDTKYMCEECAKEFCSANVLKQHIRVKHGGRIFRCDQCDFTTTTTLDLLKSHIRLVHTAAKFLCKFCSFIGDTNQELENHKRINHANEAWESPCKSNEQKRRERELQMDFTCKLCGHKLTTRQGLNFHMNATHRGVRFYCPEEGCDFSGTQQVHIRQHIDSKHKGLRHYCDMCDYSAAIATTVRIHKLRVHNVSPPIFACDQCKYRTQDNEKMRKHMINLHS